MAEAGSMTDRSLTVTRRGIVPYIATWSEERELPSRIIECRNGGIGFADESVIDRDRNGILWTRISAQPGVGRPRFAVVHSLRQRRAMLRLLCQVCGQPADRDSQGVLWLLPNRAHGREGWPNDNWFAEPPVCRTCALVATQLCPALRKDYVLVRAGSTRICGVHGLIYRSGRPAPVFVSNEFVDLHSPVIRWTLGQFLLRSLDDCTVVDLD
jgi:hypothetical protein